MPTMVLVSQFARFTPKMGPICSTVRVLQRDPRALLYVSVQDWDRSSYQEYYQCVETGSRDTGTRRGWQSTGWWSCFARKRMWDMWTCGTALWGMKNCTLEMAYLLVERGLPFLPRDCQGRLPVAWVKYDI